MNAALLLKHFDRLAEAPDAVPRLRRFILDLAVRGKLVAQDPNDELASELLKRIEAEKTRLVKAGEIKAPKPAMPAEDEAGPFALPSGWTWTRLTDITSYIQRGKSPKYADGTGVPVVSQKCVQWSGLDLEPCRMVSPDSLDAYESIRFLRDEDLLWNSTGTGTIGRVVRVQDPPHRLMCDSHVTVVRCLVAVAEYVRCWLRSDHVYGSIEDSASGSTNQVELTAGFAKMLPVPLPPLAEQHRIVAKVDELMALCDRLEVAQAERETRRERLTAASLHHLNQSEILAETSSVAQNRPASFLISNLHMLVSRHDQIPALRNTILNLAMQGRLSEAADNSATTAEAEIEEERRAVAAQDRRASAARQELLAADLRWKVPAHWSWRGLADLALFIDYRGKTPAKTESGVPLITAKNIKNGHLSAEPREYVSEETYVSWMTRGFPRIGDILFTTEAPMGNAAVVELEAKFALAQRAICFRLYGNTLPRFLLLQLLSPPFRRILEETATGLTAKGIKAAKLKRLPVAVPPIAEQHQIVEKVNELMDVCDRLEESLCTGRETSRRLLEAVLRDALQPALEEVAA